MKLAVVIGHNERRQGAVRRDNGMSEYMFNSIVAQHMVDDADTFGLDVKVFRRVDQGSYSREIKAVYANVDEWGADASMELHFNAAENAAASGTLTLISGSVASSRLGADVNAAVVRALGLRDRGVETRSTSAERGGLSLISGRCPAILVEPFFATSEIDLAATDEVSEVGALAEAYLAGAARAMAGFPRKDLADSRTMKAVRTQGHAVKAQVASATAAAVASAASEAQLGLASVPVMADLLPWLPYVGGACGLLAVGATVVVKIQATAIANARVDDHQRGAR